MDREGEVRRLAPSRPSGRVVLLPRLPAAGRDQLTPIRSVISYQPATLGGLIGYSSA